MFSNQVIPFNKNKDNYTLQDGLLFIERDKADKPNHLRLYEVYDAAGKKIGTTYLPPSYYFAKIFTLNDRYIFSLNAINNVFINPDPKAKEREFKLPHILQLDLKLAPINLECKYPSVISYPVLLNQDTIVSQERESLSTYQMTDSEWQHLSSIDFSDDYRILQDSGKSNQFLAYNGRYLKLIHWDMKENKLEIQTQFKAAVQPRCAEIWDDQIILAGYQLVGEPLPSKQNQDFLIIQLFEQNGGQVKSILCKDIPIPRNTTLRMDSEKKLIILKKKDGESIAFSIDNESPEIVPVKYPISVSEDKIIFDASAKQFIAAHLLPFFYHDLISLILSYDTYFHPSNDPGLRAAYPFTLFSFSKYGSGLDFGESRGVVSARILAPVEGNTEMKPAVHAKLNTLLDQYLISREPQVLVKFKAEIDAQIRLGNSTVDERDELLENIDNYVRLSAGKKLTKK